MHKFLLTTLLSSLSTCAFALFPIQTDWQANHLQGKGEVRYFTVGR